MLFENDGGPRRRPVIVIIVIVRVRPIGRDLNLHYGWANSVCKPFERLAQLLQGIVGLRRAL
jgi:hypothetical protein